MPSDQPSYDLDLRRRARDKQRFLFTIDVQGQPIQRYRTTFQGTITEEQAERLKQFALQLFREEDAMDKETKPTEPTS